jgi:glycosyltransferase involved in cell wall biosynthesis
MPEGTRVRLLWLSKETPDRDGQGGQRRQYFQIRELRAAGVEVIVLTPAGEQSDASIGELTQVIRFRRRRFRSPAPDPVRLALRGGFDRMVLAHGESLDLLRGRHAEIPVPWLADFHNVNSRWYAQQGNAPVTEMWFGIERAILASANASISCSRSETEALLAQAPTAQVTEAPNGIDPTDWPDSALGARQPHTVAAFGSWWYPPNRDGIEWFATRVWPLVRAAVPEARLVLAGSGDPSPSVLRGDGIEFAGRVPDIAQFLGKVAVVTVPVLLGPGTPVKFAEALASGAAVASTVHAGSGNSDAPALMSDDPAHLADGIAALLIDPEEAARRGAAARAYAIARCTWSITQQPLVDWVLHGEIKLGTTTP